MFYKAGGLSATSPPLFVENYRITFPITQSSCVIFVSRNITFPIGKNIMKKAKYIFVTGGVTSSLGKGIVAASLAKLLQSRGFRTTIQKFDPYLNVDPGTLSSSATPTTLTGASRSTESERMTPLFLKSLLRVLEIDLMTRPELTLRSARDILPADAFTRSIFTVVPDKR